MAQRDAPPPYYCPFQGGISVCFVYPRVNLSWPSWMP